jgi:hypothetical protein
MDFYRFVQICPLNGISLSSHLVFYIAFVVDLLRICMHLLWICIGFVNVIDLYDPHCICCGFANMCMDL